MNRSIHFALLVAIGASCSNSPTGLLSGSELAALNAAEARWQQRGFANYTYETRTLCFCPPDIYQWARVHVRGGVVTRVEHIDANPPGDATNLSYWQPIDSAFSRLREAARKPNNDIFSDIKVEFDATLGYPTRVEFVERPTIADAASVAERRNVKPLP
jgi:hypothetical protein